MTAVVCQNAELRVDELPEPVPAAGQVRLRVMRCGICGSDLHRPVIFECVGVPGVIDSIIDGAPLFSRVVVVGVCVASTGSRPRWRSTRRSTCAS